MLPWTRFPLIVVAACVALSCYGARDASGQSWPTEPVALLDGRLLLAADASLTYGTADPGWFAYTDYATDALRRARAGLTLEVRAARWLAFLAEVRAESGSGVRPYAWYVRFTPDETGLVTVQAGRIPPVFGAYARRSYPQDNPLVGDPLLYQYLTTIRADSVPASTDDLARQRGRGWLVRYPVGNLGAYSGLPVVSSSRWDTGVQGRVGTQALEAAVAVTTGTLSNPLVANDNGGWQLAGRAAWRPRPFLSVGVSAARGAFLTAEALASRPAAGRPGRDQQAFGVDVETSWDRWIVRGEFVANRWRVPPLDAPAITDPLGVRAAYVETRVRLRPGLYVAARADRLWFSSIRTSSGETTWDADVSRVEVGLGYTIRRGLLLKSSVLSHWRDGGRIRRDTLAGIQLLFWL
ncbi:MAG: hypothetical protein WCP29_15415 [Acidobacteriota bacterium]